MQFSLRPAFVDATGPRLGNFRFRGRPRFGLPSPVLFLATENVQVPYLTLDNLLTLRTVSPFGLALSLFPLLDVMKPSDSLNVDSVPPPPPLSRLLTFYPHFPTLVHFSEGLARGLSRKGVLRGNTRAGKRELRPDSEICRPPFLTGPRCLFDLAVDAWDEIGGPPRRKGMDVDQIRSASFGCWSETFPSGGDCVVADDDDDPVSSVARAGVLVGDVFELSPVKVVSEEEEEEVNAMIPKSREVRLREKLMRVGAGSALCRIGYVGVDGPLVMLDWVSAGVDILITAYPLQMAKLGFACVFPLVGLLDDDDDDVMEEGDENDGATATDQPEPETTTTATFRLNMSQDSFRVDFRPVVRGCSCLACKEHTRAYIHHLLRCHEMTAYVLLTLHNVHHCLRFVSAARRAIEEGNFETFREFYRDLAA